MPMSKTADNKEFGTPTRATRGWALAGTVAFHAAVMAALLLLFLRYPPKDAGELPPQPQSEIIFDEVEELYASGEYVRIGDAFETVADDTPAPSDADQPLPSQPGPDAADAGAKGNPSKPVSSDNPSPAKVDKTPKGPTKEQLEAERRQQEAERRQQAQKTAADATSRAFGGNGNGQQGQTDGNSTTGATSGTPGNGVTGRTLAHFNRVSSTKLGTIAIRVKVDAQGKVTSAEYVPQKSTGAAAADPALRESCRRKSLECRFSVKEGAPTATGYLTWTFK